MKKIIYIVLMISVLSASLYAKAKIHEGDLVFLNQKVAYKDKKIALWVHYDAKIHWKFWIQMGEPVMMSNMIWTPTIAYKQIFGKDSSAMIITDTQLLKKLRLYEFMVQANLKQSVYGAYVVTSLKTLGSLDIDSGVGAYPFTVNIISDILKTDIKKVEDRYVSFNTPGSKDWDKFLMQGGHYISAKRTKQYFSQSKIILQSGNVIKANMDFSALLDHYAKEYETYLIKKRESEYQSQSKKQLAAIEKKEKQITKEQENTSFDKALDSIFDEKNIQTLSKLQIEKRQSQDQLKDASKYAKKAAEDDLSNYISELQNRRNQIQRDIAAKKEQILARTLKNPQVNTMSQKEDHGDTPFFPKKWKRTKDAKPSGGILNISQNGVHISYYYNNKPSGELSATIKKRVDKYHWILKQHGNNNAYHLIYTKEHYLILLPANEGKDSEFIDSFRTVDDRYTKDGSRSYWKYEFVPF